jgi:hypothetical protein
MPTRGHPAESPAPVLTQLLAPLKESRFVMSYTTIAAAAPLQQQNAVSLPKHFKGSIQRLHDNSAFGLLGILTSPPADGMSKPISQALRAAVSSDWMPSGGVSLLACQTDR